MTNEHWTERFSDYLDGELSERDRSALEAHLALCGECSRTLDEVQAVVRDAAALGEVPLERDLWPGILSRLAPRAPADHAPDAGVFDIDRARRRRVVLSVPQLVAAAITLVLLSASGAWLALGGAGAPDPLAVTAAPGGFAGTAAGTPVFYTEPYQMAVAELEAEFEARRGSLDPATIVVLERNLAIIETAIAEARRALAEDPSSSFLNSYLANTMRRKVDLLRQAARIERSEI